MTGRIHFVGGMAAVSLALAALSGCEGPETTGASGVRYAPDGTLTVFTPAGIKVYDAKMTEEQKSIQLAKSSGTVDVPFSFDLARDGTTAAVGYSNTVTKDVAILRMPSGERLTTIDVPQDPQNATTPVQQVTLSPRGDLVYVRGPSPGVYDTATGSVVWADTASANGRKLPTFSTDGATLFGVLLTATAAHVEAVDARTGTIRFGFDVSGITALNVTPDGQNLVGIVSTPSCARDVVGPCTTGSARREETYTFWSTADGSVVKELPQFADVLSAASLVATGGSAVTCAAADGPCATTVTDGDQLLVLVWNPDGTLLHTLTESSRDLAFSPDGGELAVASAGARVFRVSDGALLGARKYTYESF